MAGAGMQLFDRDAVFDEDYLAFYDQHIGDAPSEEQAERAFRLLDPAPGASVLDLACGHGRIANRLAARGLRVTGLDASERFLAIARRDAERRGVAVEYVQADMRDERWHGRFDAVLSWFTSFGYFDDAGNLAVLRAARAALRPRGRLVLETLHAPALMRRFADATVVEHGDDLMVDRHRFDALTSRVCTARTYVRRDRPARRVDFAVRVVQWTELARWLDEAGFSRAWPVAGDGSELALDSRRLVAIAER